MLKFALIVGSTRPNRFADVPARWLREGAAVRREFELETLDLRDQNLPLLNEPVPPAMSGGVYSEPAAEAWRAKLAKYDAFIVTAAEYNHGPAAVLKNAFDSAFVEWQRKPIAFVGYGSVGGSRSIEALRGTAIELQMAPIRYEVNIGLEPFLGILMNGKSLDDYVYLAQARTAMFDDLVWWANALQAARQTQSAKAA